ncbi:MAG: hypothetical protein VYD05_13620, partial [Planctomycetota bacterium]|nr:hypothetical protein [Planctomycetota bacterium]
MKTSTAALLTTLFAHGFVLGQAPGFARVFDDHMVLQRDEPVRVWGWGDAGATAVVRFGAQERAATVAIDGRWEVLLDAMPASADGRP